MKWGGMLTAGREKAAVGGVLPWVSVVQSRGFVIKSSRISLSADKKSGGT